MTMDIALIGPGKVGCAIARRLHQAGYPITAVIGRDLARTIDACNFIGCSEKIASTKLRSAGSANAVLLAVPDDQILELAITLQQQVSFSPAQTLIHFSGVHAAALMRSAKTTAANLSIPPLLPFASRALASEKLTGCPCALEGDQTTLALGEELISAFDGQPFRIASSHKALYHASACIASNFLVSLLASATELLAECGIEQEHATQLLLPLVQASLDNVAQFGPQQGLTGPIVRGDTGTVDAHLVHLRKSAPHLLPLYQVLGCQTIELAQAASRLPQSQGDKLRQLLDANNTAES